MYFILLIISSSITLFSYNALACSCANKDINELYAKADIVVLATAKEFKEEQQSVNITKHIKGEVSQSGLILSQQESICRYPQLPIHSKQEYLLFVSKVEDKYKFTSRCYNYVNEKGFYNMRMNDSYAQVHRSMLPSFFKAQGAIPKIKLYTSYNLTENGITNWLSIINQDNKNIEVFHPNNRQAFTFIVLDNYGNIIQPTGYAKVDPPAEQVLTISNDSAYNYTIKPISDFYFPYLSGTAQFGYKLEKNKKYKMHIIYRPFGGTYGSISSEEKEVRIY